METKFQTSFIPKKPILSTSSPVSHGTVSFFLLISVLFFIASLAGAGFVVFWKGALLKTQSDYGDTLKKNESQFDLATIDTLRRVNTKIDIAKQLWASHLAATQVFGIMGALTAQNSTFSSLDYTSPVSGASDGLAHISMSGTAKDFISIAFQSDVLGASSKYGQNIVIKNPVLSGLSLNPNGNVSFNLTAAIDTSNLTYQKYLTSALGGSSVGSVPVGSSTNSQSQ